MQSDQYRDLFERLQAWTFEDSTFHGNRQLADEVLIIDGWRVVEDAGFEGGFRWSWGTNPEYSASESNRPHPLIDLSSAYGLVPFDGGCRLEWTATTATAWIWRDLPSPLSDPIPFSAQGKAATPSAAICAAFVMWKWLQAKKEAANG